MGGDWSWGFLSEAIWSPGRFWCLLFLVLGTAFGRFYFHRWVLCLGLAVVLFLSLGFSEALCAGLYGSFFLLHDFPVRVQVCVFTTSGEWDQGLVTLYMECPGWEEERCKIYNNMISDCSVF